MMAREHDDDDAGARADHDGIQVPEGGHEDHEGHAGGNEGNGGNGGDHEAHEGNGGDHEDHETGHQGLEGGHEGHEGDPEDHAAGHQGLEGGHEGHEGNQDHEDADERSASYRCHFIERVTAMPSLDFAIFFASNSYRSFKRSYATTGKVLDAAEMCASFAYASFGQAAVDRLSKPLLVADVLACRALQKLELCCPKIRTRPHEIIEDVCELWQRKYDGIHAYVEERVEAGRDLSERVADAAVHPIDTARSCIRIAGDFADRQLQEAEFVSDAYMIEFLRVVTPDNDPRSGVVPRLICLSWKAFVCLSYYVNEERRRTADYTTETMAAVKRFFDEPAEPVRKPITLSGHAEAALRHICKACVLPFQPPSDVLFDLVITEAVRRFLHLG